MQDAPWPHGNNPLANAAAMLFEQGLADPRGLEYSEIVLGVVAGDATFPGPFRIVTHGWIFPDDAKGQRFAVAWNGLVYPVITVVGPADLEHDWPVGKEMLYPDYWSYPGFSEAGALDYKTPGRLKEIMLLRLRDDGKAPEPQPVYPGFGFGGGERKPIIAPDPYLSLADWLANVAARAASSHARGDDRLALADARLLARAQPLIEAEAARRGLPPDRQGHYADEPEPEPEYFPFLAENPALLADSERRIADPKPDPIVPLPMGFFVEPSEATKANLAAGNVAALIEDLDNFNAGQRGSTIGAEINFDPRAQALVQLGDKAVLPLLETMEKDTRLARSVSQTGSMNDAYALRHLVSVADVAYAILTDILQFQFKSFDESFRSLPLPHRQVAGEIRAYWAKMEKLTLPERFYAILRDDKADPSYWGQAASYILQPTDEERHNGWISPPDRKPGQKIVLRGESLRDGRTPSVSSLLARRSDDIASIRTKWRKEHYLYISAGRMALHLAEWDKAAAIPVLKKRLERAWSIGAKADDPLAKGGFGPTMNFGPIIAKMTLARAQAGEPIAYDEYTAWLRKADLEEARHRSEELLAPLIVGAARPAVQQTLEYLFNDPASFWYNVLEESNGYWDSAIWESAIVLSSAFRPQARRILANTTFGGTITFQAHTDQDPPGQAGFEIRMGSGSGNYTGSNQDPDTPPPFERRSFRVCDAAAYHYAKYHGAPPFQLFWPEAKRDAGVAACREWLETRVAIAE